MRVKTFSTHVRLKKRHVVSKFDLFTHESTPALQHFPSLEEVEDDCEGEQHEAEDEKPGPWLV